jgi:hypothetical protein
LERRSNRTLLNKFPEGQLVIVVDGVLVRHYPCWLPKISLLKHVLTKQLQETFHFQLTTLKEVLYGIDVLSTLNTADFDWVAVYDVRKELCEQLNLKSIILREFQLWKI